MNVIGVGWVGETVIDRFLTSNLVNAPRWHAGQPKAALIEVVANQTVGLFLCINHCLEATLERRPDVVLVEETGRGQREAEPAEEAGIAAVLRARSGRSAPAIGAIGIAHRVGEGDA